MIKRKHGKKKRVVPLFSMQRAKILQLIHEKPMTISQLSKETGLKRTTLYFHINILKKNSLIHEEVFKNKQGKPVFICSDKVDLMPKCLIDAFDLLHPKKND